MRGDRESEREREGENNEKERGSEREREGERDEREKLNSGVIVLSRREMPARPQVLQDGT